MAAINVRLRGIANESFHRKDTGRTTTGRVESGGAPRSGSFVCKLCLIHKGPIPVMCGTGLDIRHFGIGYLAYDL